MLALNQLLYDTAICKPSYTLNDIIKLIEAAKGEQFPNWLYEKACFFVDEAMVAYAKEEAKMYGCIDPCLKAIGMGVGHLKTCTVDEKDGGRLEYKLVLDHYEALVSPDKGKLRYWMELTESMVDNLNSICDKTKCRSVRVFACTQSYDFLRRFEQDSKSDSRDRRRRKWVDEPPVLLDKRINLIKTNGEKSDKIPLKDKKYEGVLKDWVGTLVRSRLFIPPQREIIDALLPPHVQSNLIAMGRTLDIKEELRRKAPIISEIRRNLRNRTHENEDYL